MADADPPPSADSEPFRTWIGSATPDRITVGGRDLPSEVMGRLTLTELAYLLVTRREPTAGERRIVDAVLVSLADHGLTPSALGGAAHLYRRTRSHPGRSRRRVARRGQRVPRPGRRHGVLPRRRARRPERTTGRMKRRSGASPRPRSRSVAAPGSACPGSVTPCTAPRIRVCRACTSSRRRRVCSARISGSSSTSPPRTSR